MARADRESCRVIDFGVLYRLAPAFALMTIGIGVAAARRVTRPASP